MVQDHIFLSMTEALTAICLDFRSYGPQPMLFCEILRTLFYSEITYKRDPERQGLWMSNTCHGRMHWLEGDALVERMCHLVTNAHAQHLIGPEAMAVLCRQVFQASCQAVREPESGQWGVRVQTDMRSFECRQCGQCCRQLDYRNGITREDVARLERGRRSDILKWVRPVRSSGGEIVYRIWVTPDTNQFAHPCPFLKRGASRDRWICSIHGVKPHICSNYPVSRKHALMTGCPGFDISRQ